MKAHATNLTGAEVIRVHLRGRRVDLLAARLDLGHCPTDGVLRSAVETALGFTHGTLAGYRIDPGEHGNRTLRPRGQGE